MGTLGVTLLTAHRRLRMDRVLITTVAVGLTAFSACSRIAERAFARPTIAVRSVKLKSVGLTGGSLEVALRDSPELGRGESPPAFTLPAPDSAVVDLPVDVSWQGLRAAARDAARDG